MKRLKGPLVKKKKETARETAPRTFDEHSQGGTLALLKQTARERTQEPSKNQWKGGSSEQAQERRNVGKRKKKKKDKKKR